MLLAYSGPTSRTLSPPGNSLYSGTASGTYYYDVRNTRACQTDFRSVNSGIPFCASWNGGPAESLTKINSNNIIAIDSHVLTGKTRAQLCGKQVIVTYKNKQVLPPDGGSFFLWDSCESCNGGGRIDFSFSGLQKVNSNACFLGVVPGVSFQVTNTQVKKFVK
jgi:hypothetical protein